MKRGKAIFLLLLAIGILLSLVGYALWPLLVPPVLPGVDLTEVDREIALAIRESQLAVLNDPSSGLAHGRLGMVLLVHGYEKAAADCFRKAQRLASQEPRWPYFLATIDRQDPKAVRAHLQRAVELSGDNPPTVRLRLAEFYLEQEQFDEAHEQFERIYRLDSKNLRACLGLARIALEKERYSDGLNLLKSTQSRLAAVLRANLLQCAGDFQAAEKERGLAERLPNDPPWLDPFHDELAAYRAGKRHRLKQLGDLQRQGKIVEAMEIGRRLEKINPEVYWLVEGRQSRDRGAIDEAIRAYQESLRLDPMSLDARIELAELYKKSGKLDQAISEYQKLLNKEPGNGPSWLALGECQWEKGNREEAVTSLRHAVSCMPFSANAHRKLASVLSQTAQSEEAERHRKLADQLNAHHR